MVSARIAASYQSLLIRFMLCLMSGDSTCGQRAVYQLGLTGIPIYNVSAAVSAVDKCSMVLLAWQAAVFTSVTKGTVCQEVYF